MGLESWHNAAAVVECRNVNSESSEVTLYILMVMLYNVC